MTPTEKLTAAVLEFPSLAAFVALYRGLGLSDDEIVERILAKMKQAAT